MTPKLPIILSLCLAACSELPGPSVAMQPGKTLQAQNAAIRTCSPGAAQGGRSAVTGNYVAGIILGGLIVGPIIVASNEDIIRADGEANAVDRCLAKQGFKRRDLTPAEVTALNQRSGGERQRLLDHLIKGGTLETFNGGA